MVVATQTVHSRVDHRHWYHRLAGSDRSHPPDACFVGQYLSHRFGTGNHRMGSAYSIDHRQCGSSHGSLWRQFDGAGAGFAVGVRGRISKVDRILIVPNKNVPKVVAMGSND